MKTDLVMYFLDETGIVSVTCSIIRLFFFLSLKMHISHAHYRKAGIVKSRCAAAPDWGARRCRIAVYYYPSVCSVQWITIVMLKSALAKEVNVLSSFFFFLKGPLWILQILLEVSICVFTQKNTSAVIIMDCEGRQGETGEPLCLELIVCIIHEPFQACVFKLMLDSN